MKDKLILRTNKKRKLSGYQIDSELNRIVSKNSEKRLSPRSMQVLVYMHERANRLVTRAELLKVFWREHIGGDDALAHIIRELRIAFGDSGTRQEIIQTIPKKGYRLLVQKSPNRAAVYSMYVGLAALALFTVGIIGNLMQGLSTHIEVDKLSDFTNSSAPTSVTKPEDFSFETISLMKGKEDHLPGLANETETSLDNSSARNRSVNELDTALKVDVHILDFYHRGHNFLDSRLNNRYSDATRMFSIVTKRAPNYALGWAWLSITSSMAIIGGESTPQFVQWSRAGAQIAMEIAPWLPESHTAKALTLPKGEAIAEHQTATFMGPENYAVHYYAGMTARSANEPKLAIKWLEMAHQISPEQLDPLFYLPDLYGKLDDRENQSAAWVNLANAIESARLTTANDMETLTYGAYAFAATGDDIRAITWIEQLADGFPTSNVALYNVACFYSRLGAIDKAMEYLEASIRYGWSQQHLLKTDPDIDPLRKLPEFDELLAKFESGAIN